MKDSRTFDAAWKILLSISSYVVTYIISVLARDQIFFLAGWREFFVPLLIVSCGITIILILGKLGVRTRLLLISLKLVIILVIGYPLGRYLAIEQTLLFIFILEAELYLPGKWGVLAAAGGIAAILMNQGDVLAWGLNISGATQHDFLVMLVHSLLFFILVTISRFAIRQAQESKQQAEHYDNMVQEIAQANLGFQDHAEEIERHTKNAERKRITRELHDSMGYTLTSQKMMLEAALLLSEKNPEKLHELLKKAKMQIEEGHADVRRSLRILRKVENEKVSYLNRLKHITENFSQATGVHVQLDTSNLPLQIDPETALILHRLIQEGMTNAFGHGKADEIMISLFNKANAAIIVTIIDNGRGADDIEEGIGLRGMKERIEPIGGNLRCHNLYPGFKLVAEIPYEIRKGD